MNEVMCTVASSLEEMELKYEIKGAHFSVILGDEEADFHFYIIPDEENKVFTVIGRFPVRVPKSIRERMYGFVNELNNESDTSGFFAISKEGELSLCLSSHFDGGVLTEETVKACFSMVAYRLLDSYENTMNVMFGGGQYTFCFADNGHGTDERA